MSPRDKRYRIQEIPPKCLPDLGLLQYDGQLVVVEEVEHRVLGEQPHGEQGKTRILTRKPDNSHKSNKGDIVKHVSYKPG